VSPVAISVDEEAFPEVLARAEELKEGKAS
jgi:hypothetical protein